MYPNAWQGKQLRVVGVEDGGFPSETPLGFRSGKTILVGVLTEGIWIEDFCVCKITIDGLDATSQLVQMLRKIDFDVVMLGGVSFAGFNLVDPVEVSEKFGAPVIVISRRKPNNVAVKSALMRHFKDWKQRWAIIERLGPIAKVISKPGEAPIYMEVMRADSAWARKVVRKLSVISRVPEPVRVARLIAHGLTQTIRTSGSSSQ